MRKLWILMALFFTTSLAFSQDDDETVEEEDAYEVIEDDFDIDTIDFDINDIEEDELGKTSSFPWEKFAVGGQIGNLQFGNTTNLSFAPEIVYKATDNFAFGVDGIYKLTKANRLWNGFQYVDANYKSSDFGGRAFTRITPVTSFPIFAQLEYERLNQENPYDIETTQNQVNYFGINQSVSNANAGLGFMNGPYYLALMYNFMHNSNRDEFFDLASDDYIRRGLTPPSSFNNRLYPVNALSFRGGLNIPLGGGNKNKKRDKNKKRKDKKETEDRKVEN